MQFTLITAVALFAVSVYAQDVLHINAPALVQCASVKSSWSPGEAPYNIIVVAADDVCGEPLVNIGDTYNTSIEWIVAIKENTTVQVSVADSRGKEGWTENIIVRASSDSSCLKAANATNTGSTGSTSSGSSSTGSGATTPGSVAAPIGAANAGTNNLFNSGAPSAREASVPVMALAAIAAVAALAL